MLLFVAAAACAVRRTPAIAPLAAPPCVRAGADVTWYGPAASRDRKLLTDWCESVGPAVVTSPRAPMSARLASSGLAVVTWNVHEGRGDVEEFVRALAPADVIILMQEAVHANRGSATQGRDVEALAGRAGLWLAYAPSMPNGPNGRRTGEDRGCAILSTLPLESPSAIELPWVRQRRVAVMATFAARGSRLRVVSVHLDNRSGRKEQANALADWLRPVTATGDPVIVGGDFNSWFGSKEQTVEAIDRVVPLIQSCGERGSFRFGLRLDHLFATSSVGVADCQIASDTYGSDHHPVVARLK